MHSIIEKLLLSLYTAGGTMHVCHANSEANLYLSLCLKSISSWIWVKQSRSGLQPKRVGQHFTHSFAKEQMEINNGDSRGSDPPKGSLEPQKLYV